MSMTADTPAAADSTSVSLVPVQPGPGFEIRVKTWATSAIEFLETATEEKQRVAVRDEAVRVAAIAEAAGGGVALATAHEILQRAIRALGKASPRRSAGRPAIGGGDAPPPPVRGDKIPVDQQPGRESPRGPATRNRSTGRTISGDCPAPEGCDLPSVPKATRSGYRKDAEAISDEGFERTAEAVRAKAEGAPAAGHKLDRATVRAAGAVEAEGGDPGDLKAVEVKKRALSDARKRSSPQGDGGSSAASYAPRHIVDVGRKLLGGAIDLDPASCEAANRHVGAAVFHDRAAASPDGLKAEWPKGATVWLHLPHDDGLAERFVKRVLEHAKTGAPVVLLTDNRSQTPWAQSLLKAARGVCFVAGDVKFLRPRPDDPTALDEAPAASPHGQMLVGFNVDGALFRQLCTLLGTGFTRGAVTRTPA